MSVASSFACVKLSRIRERRLTVEHKRNPRNALCNSHGDRFNSSPPRIPRPRSVPGHDPWEGVGSGLGLASSLTRGELCRQKRGIPRYGAMNPPSDLSDSIPRISQPHTGTRPMGKAKPTQEAIDAAQEVLRLNPRAGGERTPEDAIAALADLCMVSRDRSFPPCLGLEAAQHSGRRGRIRIQWWPHHRGKISRDLAG